MNGKDLMEFILKNDLCEADLEVILGKILMSYDQVACKLGVGLDSVVPIIEKGGLKKLVQGGTKFVICDENYEKLCQLFLKE